MVARIVLKTVFFLLVARFAIGTEIEARGTLYCQSWKNWCLYIGMFENDLIKDDRLDYYGVICRRPSIPYFIKLDGEENGDGLKDNFFELSIYIRHNCTNDGSIRMVTRKFEPFSVDLPKINLDYTTDVTDQGIRVPSYFF